MTIAEKRELENDIQAMQAQLEVLRERLGDGGGPTRGDGPRPVTLADLKADFDEIQQEMEQTRSQMEELKHYFESGQEENKKLLEDMDLRLQDLEKGRPTVPKEEAKEEAQASPTKKAPKETPADSEEESYREAIAPFQKGKGEELTDGEIEAAQKNLRAFLKKYPKSKYQPNVYYWLGETYYAQKKYKQAIVEFESVIKVGESPKSPAARLKQGYCFLALENPEPAEMLFQQVVRKYPDSPEAKLAKAKLEELKKNSGKRSQTP